MILRVIFHLKKKWIVNEKEYDLWEDIKSGKKTSEYRKANDYWLKRLPIGKYDNSNAWFVVGYPKGNLPRLEAEIYEIIYHEYIGFLEIKFKNVIEVKDK